MKIVGLIPSRMESSRFPGKPLVDIEGLPMIIHVLKRAELCRDFSEVYVATDSHKISDTVKRHGGKAIMTSSAHKTGTDRIAEAAEKIKCDIVVNIQGDEPLVNPKDIEKLLKAVKKDTSINAATLVCKTPEFNNITECKVVTDLKGDILYMSRSDIPSSARGNVTSLYKLYCIVAFRRDFLRQFSSWAMTTLEKVEYIEYLRILEHGCKMRAVAVKEYTTSVDTPEDLKVVSRMMEKDRIKACYLNV